MEQISAVLELNLKMISDDINFLKQKLQEVTSANYFPEWIPRKTIMQFLDYGDTQMAALLKKKDLVISEVGARKFIEKKSFLKFLEKNIRKVNPSLTDK